MNLYKIVGLTLTNFTGNSYETRNNWILHDENGVGITKSEFFNKYILYVVFENTYYAINLSETHCASYGGKLCYNGSMNIVQSSYTNIQSSITHIPIKPLIISANFEEKNYNYEDDIRICLQEEPNTCLFTFSNIGNDEMHPNGYVYVNMNLFNKL
jgi:hypothetical protein